LDKGGNIMPYSWISNDYEGREADELPEGIDRVGTVHISGNNVDLFVEQVEEEEEPPLWLFSSESLDVIAAAEIEEVVCIDTILPDFLKNSLVGGVAIGQWITFFQIARVAYLISWGVIAFLLVLVPKIWRKARADPPSGVITALSLPFRIYFALWIFVDLSERIGISIIIRQRFSGFTVIVGFIAF